MKMKFLKRVAFVAAMTLVVYGCKKQSSPSPNTTPLAPHNYGVTVMTPDQWSFVPVFSADVVGAASRTTGLSAGTLPSSFLLASPEVRDQGQIGCCTGFCGAESDEILNYYKDVTSAVTATSLTSATGLSTAVGTEFSGASLFGSSGGL